MKVRLNRIQVLVGLLILVLAITRFWFSRNFHSYGIYDFTDHAAPFIYSNVYGRIPVDRLFLADALHAIYQMEGSKLQLSSQQARLILPLLIQLEHEHAVMTRGEETLRACFTSDQLNRIAIDPQAQVLDRQFLVPVDVHGYDSYLFEVLALLRARSVSKEPALLSSSPEPPSDRPPMLNFSALAWGILDLEFELNAPLSPAQARMMLPAFKQAAMARARIRKLKTKIMSYLTLEQKTQVVRPWDPSGPGGELDERSFINEMQDLLKRKAAQQQ